MAQIAQVSIRRFKLLQHLDIPLADVTILVGSNNAGKSSVLQAIHLGVALAQTSKLIGTVSWRKDTYQLSFNPAQLLYSPVSDALTLATGGALHEPADEQIEIGFVDNEGNQCQVALRRGRNRNLAVTIEGRALGEQLQDLEHPFSIYAPGLAGVPREEQYRSPGVIRRVVARGDANLVLRNVLFELRQNQDRWEEFLEWIRTVFPEIDFAIGFDQETDENITANVSLGGGPFLPVDSAGTSILQTCQILAYVALFKPKILILDEPDSHLHPDNQKKIMATIERLASDLDLQAVISTHSRHVLDAVRRHGLVHWLSNGTIVNAPDLSTLDILLDIGALDSVDFFANGQIRCVVATEDTDPKPLRTLLASNGFVDDETYIASYSGVTKVEAAQVLSSFLGENAPGIRFLVHRDRDYLTEEALTGYVERLEQAGITPLIPSTNDIEGIFLNSSHLAHLNPELTPEEIDELVDQVVEETREGSIKAIVDQRTEEAFRVRRAGGPSPNHGQISISAHAEYDADPRNMARGKLVLSRLIGRIQDRLGHRPIIYSDSEHLGSEEIKAIADELWP